MPDGSDELVPDADELAVSWAHCLGTLLVLLLAIGVVIVIVALWLLS